MSSEHVRARRVRAASRVRNGDELTVALALRHPSSVCWRRNRNAPAPCEAAGGVAAECDLRCAAQATRATRRQIPSVLHRSKETR